ncbi:hypothetical protein MHYP_G00088820 [Metynnis hypsauchen]
MTANGNPGWSERRSEEITPGRDWVQSGKNWSRTELIRMMRSDGIISFHTLSQTHQPQVDLPGLILMYLVSLTAIYA